jgi:hypothetical protein
MEPSSNTPVHNESHEVNQPQGKSHRLLGLRKVWVCIIIVAFLAGNGSGFFINEQRHARNESNLASQDQQTTSEMAHMARQVNPPAGYQIKANFGAVGPELLAAGAMNYAAFLEVYEQAGVPLNETQQGILAQGSLDRVTIHKENAYFLLNFFWALGLTNRNPILTEGPMVTNSQGQFENFASTGGWSIGAKPIRELYASTEIVSLTDDQQSYVVHFGCYF